MVRKIIFYKHYFHDFFNRQPDKVKEKIDFVLYLIENVQRVPTSFLKYITGTDGLFEIRIQVGTNIFRFFCFFD